MAFRPPENATTRFSDRVEAYIQYRPGYPSAVVEFLRDELGLDSTWKVADVGSGTGIFSRLLLENGNEVWGVEPNREMRAAAERLLAAYPGFHSVEGTAEATTLPAESMALAVAAQAFHWFDPARARDEFRRFLKPGSFAVLVWNDRRVDSTPFLRAYEALLRQVGTDYECVNHRNADASRLQPFFGPGGWQERTFRNEQRFDWEGLCGRALSSSYVPGPNHPDHARFFRALREIYDAHACDGLVSFDYDLRLYYGRVA